MYSTLVLVEFHNTTPYVVVFESEEEFDMPKVIDYFEKNYDMDWDRDGITLLGNSLEEIEKINLDKE